LANSAIKILTAAAVALSSHRPGYSFGSHGKQLLHLIKSSSACKLVPFIRGYHENGIAAIDLGGAVTVVWTDTV